jgi:DNA-binding NarL/FixJ family response regulator
MNIFLIEDNFVYAKFIKNALGQNPAYTIHHFDSAESAMKAIHGSLPDALIIDYSLPGMSGIEFFESIKSMLKDGHKSIMLSALEDGNMVLSFIQKGVRDYVIKDESVIESLVAILEDKEEDYLFNG